MLGTQGGPSGPLPKCLTRAGFKFRGPRPQMIAHWRGEIADLTVASTTGGRALRANGSSGFSWGRNHPQIVRTNRKIRRLPRKRLHANPASIPNGLEAPAGGSPISAPTRSAQAPTPMPGARIPRPESSSERLSAARSRRSAAWLGLASGRYSERSGVRGRAPV